MSIHRSIDLVHLDTLHTLKPALAILISSSGLPIVILYPRDAAIRSLWQDHST
ncbi:MAG: hypothetical protein P8M08_16115 [Akkermansiaceae bacterium]|nr:hypothetical protein [Akkermansiaceae bacterium]